MPSGLGRTGPVRLLSQYFFTCFSVEGGGGEDRGMEEGQSDEENEESSRKSDRRKSPRQCGGTCHW